MGPPQREYFSSHHGVPVCMTSHTPECSLLGQIPRNPNVFCVLSRDTSFTLGIMLVLY
jgi:hypothetical protein